MAKVIDNDRVTHVLPAKFVKLARDVAEYHAMDKPHFAHMAERWLPRQAYDYFQEGKKLSRPRTAKILDQAYERRLNQLGETLKQAHLGFIEDWARKGYPAAKSKIDIESRP